MRKVESYLNSQELAKRWRIHPTTLANWRVEGKGPHFFKLGAKVLYAISDIEAWESQSKKRSTVG